MLRLLFGAKAPKRVVFILLCHVYALITMQCISLHGLSGCIIPVLIAVVGAVAAIVWIELVV